MKIAKEKNIYIKFTLKIQMSQNSLTHSLLQIVDEWITDLRQKKQKKQNVLAKLSSAIMKYVEN